jgi:polysaccharide deacetylase family protein (PEP-CTERM system associated)
MNIVNGFSVDVEEYFHPTEIQACGVRMDEWDQFPSRVEPQVRKILELLESHGVKATFFVLGWIADRHPQMIRAIAESGHEIGCHSYAHQLVYRLTPEQFRQDTTRAVDAIGNACGVAPIIYRAPSYSVTRHSMWALEILIEKGFTHDSSIYPIFHDRYGIPGFRRHAQDIVTPSGVIHEIPIATAKLSRTRIAPVGGGGYLRLLPYRYTAAGIRKVNSEEGEPVCVYLHPWELDPDQPRLVKQFLSRLRTYTGLGRMTRKVNRLLEDFSFSTVTSLSRSSTVAERLVITDEVGVFLTES